MANVADAGFRIKRVTNLAQSGDLLGLRRTAVRASQLFCSSVGASGGLKDLLVAPLMRKGGTLFWNR